MCQHEMIVFEEGRVMKCRFEISAKQYALFVAVYGILCSGGEKSRPRYLQRQEENATNDYY
jgi:hypothetical protein